MEIKILGSGCKNCLKLEANTKIAVEALGLSAHIVKVIDYNDILSYGVMRTPALVVDNKVVMSGQVPSVKQIEKLLK